MMASDSGVEQIPLTFLLSAVSCLGMISVLMSKYIVKGVREHEFLSRLFENSKSPHGKTRRTRHILCRHLQTQGF